ncbi:hypothetical protein [Nitrincola sp.]|uniref:hypothetical protein n=1 Tax=Nitrincola sp. TaxID=1926584 RepID=UPI003A93054A
MSKVHTDMETEMTNLVWAASKSAHAVEAVTNMMSEYKEARTPSADVDDHLELGLWLCQELANHQRTLLERIEVSLKSASWPKGSVRPLEGISALSESMCAQR